MNTNRLILFLLISVIIFGCDTPGDTDDSTTASVEIAASGLSDGKLAINNAATFTANLTDFRGDPADPWLGVVFSAAFTTVVSSQSSSVQRSA